MALHERYYKNFANTEWKGCQGPPEWARAPKQLNIHLLEEPILVIGLGGTGIDAALAVRKRLESTYHPKEASKVEYLFIDTDEIPKWKNVRESEQIIIQSTDTAMMLREFKMSGRKRDDILPPEISSWLDGLLSPFRVMNGAAGIRQAGRLILFLNVQRLYHMLEHKIEKIRVDHDLSKKRVRVYLFTGIGGGTGSGMFVDVSYLIRNICPSVNLEGVIFMPDVSCLKKGLRTVHKQNIQRNGFAALKELDYLMTLDRFSECFEQDYPGNIHVRFEKTPIFDFCILVGAQEDGRCAKSSEEEIFRIVSDYILLEVQEKENYSIESYKSNIANLPPREPFCDRHMAIGASSRYISTDAFYSWWLADVLRRLSRPTKPDEPLRKAAEADFKAWVGHLKYVPPKKRRRESSDGQQENGAGITHGTSRTRRSDRYENAADDLAIFWTEAFEKKTGIFAPEIMYPILFTSKAKQYQDVQTDIDKLIDQLDFSSVKCDWHYTTKELQKKYKETFIKVYAGRLRRYFDIVESYRLLHEELMKKITGYSGDVQPGGYINTRKEFEKLTNSAGYKESLRMALYELSRDILSAPDRWQGTGPQSPKWLSDHISELLAEAFYESGCASPEKLLELLSENGYNGQGEYLTDVLDGLHTAQLWPRSGVYPQGDESHNTAAVPDVERIRNWTEEWRQSSGAPDNVAFSRIRDRFVRAVLVPANALYSFDGIKSFEEAYINSSNRAGAHLYAGEGKQWRHLPSPYFETKWGKGDEKIRGEEKDRNKIYRDIFEEALSPNMRIIYYDGASRLYYIAHDGEEGEDVPVGDINGEASDPEYKELAKNMFIHMFTHREEVKRRVEIKRRTEEVIEESEAPPEPPTERKQEEDGR